MQDLLLASAKSTSRAPQLHIHVGLWHRQTHEFIVHENRHLDARDNRNIIAESLVDQVLPTLSQTTVFVVSMS